MEVKDLDVAFSGANGELRVVFHEGDRGDLLEGVWGLVEFLDF